MKKIKIFIKTSALLFMLIFSNILNAQCNLSKFIQSQGYLVGNIGEQIHQSIIGVQIVIYGSTQDLQLTSPLTENQLLTSFEQIIPLELDAYPNPFNDIIIVKSDISSNIRMQIFDLLGREIMNLENIDYVIDVSHLQSGSYIIRFSSSSKSKMLKMLKL